MSAMPLGVIDQTPELLPATLGHAKLSVVLIEPTLALFPDPRYVLLNEGYRVTPVNSSFELSLLSMSEAFTLAVVSDTLGHTGLVDATRLVRQQWPAARILVLGHASFVIEDNLYDEVLPQSCGEQDICNILGSMSAQQTHRRPFIVTTPASEHESFKRRNASSAQSSRVPNAPERMTQMQTKP
jgi:hypothetical protein